MKRHPKTYLTRETTVAACPFRIKGAVLGVAQPHPVYPNKQIISDDGRLRLRAQQPATSGLSTSSRTAKTSRSKVRFPEIAKARVREISEAHAVLSNPAARAEYDRLLAAQRKKPLASNSREPGGLAERAKPRKRRAPPSFAHRVRSAAAPFVFGLIPLTLLLLMLVGIAAVMKH